MIQVDINSTFYWKYIPVRVDPRQLLRVFLSSRFKAKKRSGYVVYVQGVTRNMTDERRLKNRLCYMKYFAAYLCQSLRLHLRFLEL